MKKKFELLAIALTMLVCAFGFAACGNSDTHTHDWGEWSQSTAPTCTEKGVETRTCKLDASHAETRTGAAALGHDFSEWKITTWPTSTEAGTEAKVCTRCGTIDETRPVSATSGLQFDSIDDDAFSVKKGTADTSGRVIIPNAHENKPVKYIADIAFRNCNNLSGVDIPDSVIFIGTWAFESCTSLTSATLPDSVTTANPRIFKGCTNLEKATIGSGITSSNLTNFFEDCTKLSEINIAENNAVYSSVNGVVFNKDKTSILYYPLGKGTIYTIPGGVTTIGNYAFAYSCLTSITIPNGVTTINNGAFAFSSSLKSVTLFNSVKTIGISAFDGCLILNDIYFKGTQAEWNAISKGIYWSESTPATLTIHYNA